MYVFDPETKKIMETNGGYSEGQPVRDIPVRINSRVNCMLYIPEELSENSSIAVLLMHNMDYSMIHMGPELAKRGFTAMGGKPGNSGNLDQELLAVKDAVDFLKVLPHVKKVVLMGHSGGATTMSAYQRIAENGIASVQTDQMLYRCSLPSDTVLTPADGIMFIDANYGNGSMSLMSIDPAVTEEGSAVQLDPAYNVLDPANGYEKGKTHYSDTFRKKYHRSQRERFNRLIDQALDMLKNMESGQDGFRDDASFIIIGGNQMKPCNKLFPQDVSMLAHTKGQYPLLHGDGSCTVQTVYSCRRPFYFSIPADRFSSCRMMSVRSFLAGACVRADNDFAVEEDGVRGIAWDEVYCTGPGNAPHIRVPALCMGMTAGYEYITAEILYERLGSEDKEIAFVEGATHDFAAMDDSYGDTEKVLYDHMAEWLSNPGRFLR